MRVYLYGSFQDGTRPNRVSKDVNFGDRIIYQTVSGFLEKCGFEVDFILPNEDDKICTLTDADRLVIGGGGLIHSMLLNQPSIEISKARKAVFGLGINWENGTKPPTIRDLTSTAAFLKGIPFLMVRDWQTKAFIRSDRAQVCPDVSLLHWIGDSEPGKERALVAHSALQPREGEVLISFNSVHTTENSEAIIDPVQLRRFGHIRTSSYHGMLLAFTVNATAEVYVHNVKQQAFFSSYWDHLDIEERDGALLVKCKDPGWFKSEVENGLERLAVHLEKG